jgi:hypothetical protein
LAESLISLEAVMDMVPEVEYEAEPDAHVFASWER